MPILIIIYVVVNIFSIKNNKSLRKLRVGMNRYTGVNCRDGSVSKMCTSGGRQCKTVPIPELHVLVHPNQTWIFPLNDIAIKVPKWTKYERNLYNFFRFLVCSQYFKSFFHFMCCQARFRL